MYPFERKHYPRDRDEVRVTWARAPPIKIVLPLVGCTLVTLTTQRGIREQENTRSDTDHNVPQILWSDESHDHIQ